MRNTVMLLLLLSGAAFPYVVGYHVDPVQAQWSGWALGDANHGVAQTVTCNFDSLSYVELFAGAVGHSGAYTASVYEGNTLLMTSVGDKVPDHGWVRFDQWPDTVAFTKGKLLTIKFTRSGGDSLQYYYDGDCGYGYGQMIAPYPPPSLTTGLAMRAYGRMNAVDSAWVGMDASFPAPMLAQSD